MKQRILSGIGIAAVMAALVGCGEITFSGLLGVHEQITFAQEGEDPYTCQEKPDWWNCKPAGNVAVAPGQFNTKVTVGQNGQQKQIKLEIDNAKPATVIELNFDKNINTDSQFVITAAQLKQNFDLKGNIVTTVQKTDEQTGYEYCTYQVPQTVCRGEASRSADAGISIETVETAVSKFPGGPGHGGPGGFPPPPGNPGFAGPGGFPGPHPGAGPHPGPGPAPHPGPVCHTEWVSRPGNMYVRFYYETTLRDITAGFMQADKSLADFQGHASDTQKVYTYKDQCR